MKLNFAEIYRFCSKNFEDVKILSVKQFKYMSKSIFPDAREKAV